MRQVAGYTELKERQGTGLRVTAPKEKQLTRGTSRVLAQPSVCCLCPAKA